jgi:hypothetical protein
MSILDDAIREHLELKRAHGADDSELKKLEDEAFGPPQRPDEIDPFAEAPTEFLMSPADTAADEPEIGDEQERSGRRPDIADLQEAPPVPSETGGTQGIEDEHSPAPDAPPPSPTDAADVPLPPPPGEAPAVDLAPPTVEAALPPVEEASAPPTEEAPVPAAEKEYPAGEHEAIVDAGPSTEERHAIADQPTQMFDVQAHVEAEAAAPATGEQASPSDEELVDAVQEEPQAAPPAPEEPLGPPTELQEQAPLETRGPDAEVAGHPPAEAEPEEGSSEFDFFNEQRLSDELDQALEAPLPPTDEHLAMPRYEDAPALGDQGAIFDFESHGDTENYEEDPSQEVLRRADEAEAAEEPAEESPEPAPAPPPPAPEPPSEETPRGSAASPSEEDDPNEFDPDTGHEDVLEDTPRFLEDAPEDDDLWFEQKPPKDFDLD